MSKPVIVPGTPEILEQFCGRMQVSARTIAVVEDDQVLGVGGVYTANGHQVLFCNISDAARQDLRRRARTLLTAARHLMGMTRPDMPVNAIAQGDIEGADALLRHLGFVPICGDVYELQGARHG